MPSLTLAEARARAAVVSDVSYALELDVTDEASFRSRVTVRFASTSPETFLELTAGTAVSVRVNDESVVPAYDGHRLALTGLRARNEVVVDAWLPYVTDGAGLHTFTDPADGQRYLGAYVGVDVTQRVFACFDQVDLKASVELTVVADPGWTVLSNARPASTEGAVRRFEPTPPIPVDLFTLCAGPWHGLTWEHDGLPMGWYARRSLAAELDRDLPDLRAVTEHCYDRYAEMFDEPFPFDSYDQVLVPGLNWGAMENPGCVTYRDELVPRGRLTEPVRRFRAAVIAHEMSHMWFGDLVTQTWWEDIWLNESFADYMGFRVSDEVPGYAGALVPFEAAHKPRGYAADRRRSTHPVAPRPEEVPDVDTASTHFDAISYTKGNAVLRQLVTWLGDEDFLAGVNAHLTAHRYGNATLADLVGALDAVSSRDVRAWAEVWLRRSGHDTLVVSRSPDGVPTLSRDGVRPHRLRVTAYDEGLGALDSRLVDLASAPVSFPEWAGRVVVPNSHGETFARVVLDSQSAAAVTGSLSALEDDLARAVLWAGAIDGPVEPFLELVSRHLASERHPAVVGAVVDRALRALALVPSAPSVLATLATACRAGLDAGGDGDAFTRGLAACSADPDELGRWLADGRTDHDLALDPTLRWSVVHRLSTLGALSADAIEAERRRDGTAEGDLGAATALAARPSASAKATAWSAMRDPDVSNRRFAALAAGLWSPEHPALVSAYVSAYVAEGPRLAARGPAFAQSVGRAFPAQYLDAEQKLLVRAALARDDVPTVLRRAWEDELDDRA